MVLPVMKYKVKHTESSLYLSLMVIVFILILAHSFYARELNIYLVLIIALLLTVFIFNYIYEKRVATHLTVEIIDKEIRKYKGQSGVLRLCIRQNGIMPVLGADITVTCGDDIQFKEDYSLKIRNQSETKSVFSVFQKSESIVELPFTAANRGTAKISKSVIRIPRLFGFGSIILESTGRSNHEIIIYPDYLAFHTKELRTQMKQGAFAANHSLFSDPLLTQGTRDYESMDNIRDIHWKLSAKNGELRTKIYEQTTDISWMILINLRSEKTYAPPSNIEEIFEKIAFLTHYATEKGIPYELISNMKTFDSSHFFKLKKSSGKVHYKNTLETLARIKAVTFTISFDNFLRHVAHHESIPTHIIFTGKTDPLITEELAYFSRKGASLYQLDEHGLEKYDPSGKRGVKS